MQLEIPPQERLAYAWAVADCHHRRLSAVHEHIVERYRKSAYQLSTSDCWQLLSEVPALVQ